MYESFRYDKEKHEHLDWMEGAPPKHGYYTVLCSIRNHWWVRTHYYWTGKEWHTHSGSPTDTVIKWLWGSWEM